MVTFSNYDRRSVDILDELEWDNLETRRSKQLAALMYKSINEIAPNYLTQVFDSTNSIHTYNLRNSTHNVFVPRPYTEAGKHSFHYRGAVLWNSLSNDTRSQTNLRSFLKYFTI